MPRPLRVRAGVADALAAGAPVVALETTLLSHGLPRPGNLDVAADLESAVRAHGAVPAHIGVVDGVATVGLTARELARLATTEVAKLGVRDLGPARAAGVDGATTVAATAHLAALAGIGVFATGGLGGVHRDASHTFDESADLMVLARTPLVVVCAGVKSVLDVPATLERLETLGVLVLGYRTDTMPGFYVTDTGLPLDWRADEPEEVAEVVRAARALDLPQAVVVAQPVPEREQLDPAEHDGLLADGLEALADRGITGKQVTPALLEHLHASSGGETVRVNTYLALANARLAARIAVALAQGG